LAAQARPGHGERLVGNALAAQAPRLGLPVRIQVSDIPAGWADPEGERSRPIVKRPVLDHHFLRGRLDVVQARRFQQFHYDVNRSPVLRSI
jgi:hypothetical protein